MTNAPSPMVLVSAFVIVVVFGTLGYMAYCQLQFEATATETCSQIVDKNDFHTETIRNNNFVNERTVYHIYDVCKDRNGSVIKNESIGYGTENEALLYGLVKR